MKKGLMSFLLLTVIGLLFFKDLSFAQGKNEVALQADNDHGKQTRGDEEDGNQTVSIKILTCVKTNKKQPVRRDGSIINGTLYWNIVRGGPEAGNVFVLCETKIHNLSKDSIKITTADFVVQTKEGTPIEKAFLSSWETRNGDSEAYSSISITLSPGESTEEKILLSVPEGNDEAISIRYKEEKPVYVTIEPIDIAQELITAAEEGKTAKAKEAIAAGADVNATNEFGNTALILAADHGHIDMVKLLVAKGANVNAKNEKDTPALAWAALNRNIELVKLLLEAGAEIDAKVNKDGGTALMVAAINGHTDVVNLLLERGADIEGKNYEGITSLMFAAMYGHPKIVRLLYDKGSNINAKDFQNLTPLMYALLTCLSV